MSDQRQTHSDIDKSSTRKQARSQDIVQDQDMVLEELVDPASAYANLVFNARKSISPTDILALQRAVGNQAVQRLITMRKVHQSPAISQASSPIQTQLTISQPGDVYEQEADKVADIVTRAITPNIQRQEEEGEEAGKRIVTEFGTFVVYPDNAEISLAPAQYEGELHVKQAVYDRINSAIELIKGGAAGIKIEGNIEFTTHVLSDIAWLMTQGVGRQLIDEIVASGKELTITKTGGGNSENADNWDACFPGPDGKPGAGSNATISYNIGKKVIGTGLEDWMKRPPAIGLAHEMIHAWSDMNGVTAPKGEGAVPGYENQAVGQGEYKDAVISENKFRAAFGLPKRPRY